MKKHDEMLEKLAEQMVRQMLNPGNDPVLDAIIDDAVRDSKHKTEPEPELEPADYPPSDNVVPFVLRQDKPEIKTTELNVSNMVRTTDILGGDMIEVEVEGFKLRGTPEKVMETIKAIEELGQKG